MPIKINGATSGSTTITAPATGSDESIELSTALAGKVAYPSGGSDGDLLTKSGTAAAWATPPSLAGLVLITTETFSAVSSVSINGCFTSAYENYVYVGHIACSSAAQISVRLRASGSDNTTAGNYLWGGAYVRWVTSSTVTGEHSTTTATSFPLTDADGNPSFFEGKFYSPAESRLTGFTNVQAFNSGGSLNDGYWETFGGSMTVTTTYDGVTIFAAAGNMTGNIRIYGLKD